MSQKQATEDPLVNPNGPSQDMSKSAFATKRPNPYAALNNGSTELGKSQEAKAIPLFEIKKEKPFAATTSFANPFQKTGQSPDNKSKNITAASFVDTSTSSPINQSSYFVSQNRSDPDTTSAPKPAIRKPQPILFAAGGSVQTPIVVIPKKEPLKGIYAFFGSEELPLNPKRIIPADMPQGLEAIPFIFKNKCFTAGLDIVDYFMKRASSAEERMYFRIIKIICMTKVQMWDKINLEFEAMGNLEKLIFEPSPQTYLPYHLRLVYALTPFLSSQTQAQSKPHSSNPNQKSNDDKTLERLFSLLSFCEGRLQTQPYPQDDLHETENVNIASICDTEISQAKWVARIFRISLIIIEILLLKASVKLAQEFLNKSIEKFPNNCLLLAYQARLKMMQGDYSETKNIFEIISGNLPKDEFLEFVAINSFIILSKELKYAEAEALITEIAQKYSEYSILALNNLAYIQFAQCKIKEAIETLEKIVRTEPWNINEVIIFNLLCAYDFYYADTKEKKKIINEIIDKYGVEFNKAAVAHELKV